MKLYSTKTKGSDSRVIEEAVDHLRMAEVLLNSADQPEYLVQLRVIRNHIQSYAGKP